MKIGVGVTNSKFGDGWSGDDLVMESDIWEFTHNADQTTIANDKNKLIKQLYDAGCTHFFLFDDDTFPIKQGWEQFFINYSEQTGIQHFVLCNPVHNKFVAEAGKIQLYDTGTGCMMFLTRKCIDTVGYINPAYGKYGFEHAAYSYRIHRSGLTPGWYVSIAGWEEFVYAYDLQGEDHGYVKSGGMTEIEKADCILENEKVFDEEVNSSKLYYHYE